MKETHRGIVTNTRKKNEKTAVTIINRFDQKSPSLPRIDDKKRWAGYPGLTGWSKKLARMIPDCDIYVEPFAGAAKVFQALMHRKNISIKNTILNDKSEFIVNWLRKEFPISNLKVTKLDFATCIKKYDSRKTFFLIDPPWFPGFYDQDFSYFNRESVKAYDEEVLELVKDLKGKFIITTRRENKTMLNSGYRHKLIKSEYVVCGLYPKLLVTTNL